MFRLRWGYVISGIITGCILLVSFIGSLPDGKLHIFFCDVGQGDAVYVRFPDGHDMLVDGGPNDMVLQCLGRHMPFWDREITMVVNSHPQNDHLKGLVSVLNRYKVDYVVRSHLGSASDVYAQFVSAIKTHHVPQRLVTRGEHISVGATSLSVIWPSEVQIARMQPVDNVLGASTDANLNDGSLVFFLRYGSFDALFPGDADSHVEGQYTGDMLADGQVELLKVPHHGSKTGMTQGFVDWVAPSVSVISVGKNSFGHPSAEAIGMLQSLGSAIHRTDQEGDIEVVSDGQGFSIHTQHIQ
jgi:competence protein ComEC